MLNSKQENNQDLEPLPLIEKGKYKQDQQLQFLLLKSSPEQENGYGADGYLAPKQTRNYNQINLAMEEIDLYQGNQQQKNDKRIEDTKAFVVDSENGGTTVFQSDHVCHVNPDSSRCSICNCNMKFYFHGGDQIKQPFDVYYADYYTVFVQKMDLNNHLKTKQFLSLSFIPHFQEWVYFVIDRQLGYGLAEYVQTCVPSIPRVLKNAPVADILRNPPHFQKLSILGDFESANISMASINQKNDLVMITVKSDTNTKGCIHWFMFSVLAKEPCTVKFSILNNQRNGQLYREGMMVSVNDSNQPERGWFRGGTNISYYQNNVDHAYYKSEQELGHSPNKENNNNSQVSPNSNSIQNQTSGAAAAAVSSGASNPPLVFIDRNFQSLDWTYTFFQKNQRVVFAYSYPFSFSDLSKYIEKIEENLLRRVVECQYLDQATRTLRIQTDLIYYQKQIIGSTRIGLPIIVLKITANRRSNMFKRRKRQVIFIIARQHPGQTPSSFVCNGFLDFVLDDSPQAQILRELYIFKIVPMMNPDGVVLGNSRCSLSGVDLNRRWLNPDKILHPEVYYVKDAMKKSGKKREIAIFCDLHGHSQQKHTFIYGCNKNTDSSGTSSWARVRLIPRIMARKTEMFSIQECRFRVSQDKSSTARIVAWNELKIQNSFTIETSFFGFNDKSNEGKPRHFTIQDMNSIGKHLASTFLEYTLIVEKLQQEVTDARGGILKLQTVIESNSPLRIGNQLFQKDKSPNSNSNINYSANINSTIDHSVLSNNNTLLNQSCNQSIPITNEVNNNLFVVPQSGGATSEQNEIKLIKGKGGNNTSNGNFNGQRNRNVSSNMGGSIKDERDSPSKISNNRQSLTPMRNSSVKKKKMNTVTNSEDTGNQDVNGDGTQKPLATLLNQKILGLLCPDMGNDWRDYFKKEELERNFKLIESGKDPNDEESDFSGSDGEPEIDLFQDGHFPYQKLQEIIQSPINEEEKPAAEKEEQKKAQVQAPWNPSNAINYSLVQNTNFSVSTTATNNSNSVYCTSANSFTSNNNSNFPSSAASSNNNNGSTNGTSNSYNSAINRKIMPQRLVQKKAYPLVQIGQISHQNSEQSQNQKPRIHLAASPQQDTKLFKNSDEYHNEGLGNSIPTQIVQENTIIVENKSGKNIGVHFKSELKFDSNTINQNASNINHFQTHNPVNKNNNTNIVSSTSNTNNSNNNNGFLKIRSINNSQKPAAPQTDQQSENYGKLIMRTIEQEIRHYQQLQNNSLVPQERNFAESEISASYHDRSHSGGGGTLLAGGMAGWEDQALPLIQKNQSEIADNNYKSRSSKQNEGGFESSSTAPPQRGNPKLLMMGGQNLMNCAESASTGMQSNHVREISSGRDLIEIYQKPFLEQNEASLIYHGDSEQITRINSQDQFSQENNDLRELNPGMVNFHKGKIIHDKNKIDRDLQKMRNFSRNNNNNSNQPGAVSIRGGGGVPSTGIFENSLEDYLRVNRNNQSAATEGEYKSSSKAGGGGGQKFINKQRLIYNDNIQQQKTIQEDRVSLLAGKRSKRVESGPPALHVGSKPNDGNFESFDGYSSHFPPVDPNRGSYNISSHSSSHQDKKFSPVPTSQKTAGNRNDQVVSSAFGVQKETQSMNADGNSNMSRSKAYSNHNQYNDILNLNQNPGGINKKQAENQEGVKRKNNEKPKKSQAYLAAEIQRTRTFQESQFCQLEKNQKSMYSSNNAQYGSNLSGKLDNGNYSDNNMTSQQAFFDYRIIGDDHHKYYALNNNAQGNTIELIKNSTKIENRADDEKEIIIHQDKDAFKNLFQSNLINNNNNNNNSNSQNQMTSFFNVENLNFDRKFRETDIFSNNQSDSPSGSRNNFHDHQVSSLISNQNHSPQQLISRQI